MVFTNPSAIKSYFIRRDARHKKKIASLRKSNQILKSLYKKELYERRILCDELNRMVKLSKVLYGDYIEPSKISAGMMIKNSKKVHKRSSRKSAAKVAESRKEIITFVDSGANVVLEVEKSKFHSLDNSNPISTDRELGVSSEVDNSTEINSLIFEIRSYASDYPITLVTWLNVLSRGISSTEVVKQFNAWPLRTGELYSRPLALLLTRLIDLRGADFVLGVCQSICSIKDIVSCKNVGRVLLAAQQLISLGIRYAFNALNVLSLGLPALIDWLVGRIPVFSFLWYGIAKEWATGLKRPIQMLEEYALRKVAQVFISSTKPHIVVGWLQSTETLPELNPMVYSLDRPILVEVSTMTDNPVMVDEAVGTIQSTHREVETQTNRPPVTRDNSSQTTRRSIVLPEGYERRHFAHCFQNLIPTTMAINRSPQGMNTKVTFTRGNITLTLNQVPRALVERKFVLFRELGPFDVEILL
jgi:hypothetical protein